MRISGSGNFIPPHIARAYGVPSAKPAVTQPIAGDASMSISPARPAASGVKMGAAAPAAPHSLIAGQVRGPIEFDGASVPRPDPGVFHMYTRAADKIEAATAIQIGRTLDVKG